MKVKLLLIAVLLVAGFSVSAQAQKAFAGRYDLLSGYSAGELAGLFGYGGGTAARNGRVSYSAYYPFLDETGSGTGRMDRKGVFRLNNGVSGNARLVGKRVAVGSFRDSWGRGFFALRKR